MTLNIKSPLSSNLVLYELQLVLDTTPRVHWDGILSRVEELIDQYARDKLFTDDVYTGISIGVLYILVYNKRDLVYAENILGVVINEFVDV